MPSETATKLSIRRSTPSASYSSPACYISRRPPPPQQEFPLCTSNYYQRFLVIGSVGMEGNWVRPKCILCTGGTRSEMRRSRVRASGVSVAVCPPSFPEPLLMMATRSGFSPAAPLPRCRPWGAEHIAVVRSSADRVSTVRVPPRSNAVGRMRTHEHDCRPGPGALPAT